MCKSSQYNSHYPHHSCFNSNMLQYRNKRKHCFAAGFETFIQTLQKQLLQRGSEGLYENVQHVSTIKSFITGFFLQTYLHRELSVTLPRLKSYSLVSMRITCKKAPCGYFIIQASWLMIMCD